MGLVVNEDKTKYLQSSRKDIEHHRLGQSVTLGNKNFDEVSDFIYLGTTINKDNNISADIKRKITLANRCFFEFEAIEK